MTEPVAAIRTPKPHQVQWPRCRWCHREIEPISIDETEILIDPAPWRHVTTGREQCEGRSNKAEPVPQIHEEPFMLAAWEFVARYRKLRRVFRELSQSRASAVRRMQDYQGLVDKLIEAFEAEDHPHYNDSLAEAICDIRDYRRSQLSAGWR